MSAMSASPPVGLPLSLIAEHKVSGNKPPPPAVTPQQVGTVAPAAPVALAVPSAPAVASQPQTNGMEPTQSPPTPAVAPPTGPPPMPASPPPPTATANTATNNNAQGLSQSDGAPVAPGSGTSTSGGSGEVEGNSAAVGDVPPAVAQPCVPPTPATVPLGEQPSVEVAPVQAPPAAAAAPQLPNVSVAVPAPAPVSEVPPPPPPPAQSLPPAPVEASPPPPSAPAALPVTTTAPAPSIPGPAPSVQENAKPSRSHKRKLQSSDAEASKKAPKVEEPITPGGDDGRKSKRARLPTQPYQSPIPELNMIAKMNNTPKASEEKLIVFYRNEFLAVRNAEGGFYVCQAMQNIYRSAPGHRSKIKIRWFSQGANDVFTPDFYDSTEFDCILTNLNLDRIEKDKYKLPAVEKQRTESILKRAIDAEKGVSQPSDAALTEEHPDGLDLSLYRHEDQLKKRRKKKDGSSKKKANFSKASVADKKPTRTSGRSSGNSADEIIAKNKASKPNEKIKSRSSKKRKSPKKNDKPLKKKEPEIANYKKEVIENNGRKSANSGAAQAVRKNAEKTKSAVAVKKAPSGGGAHKQSPAALRQTRLATPKQ